MRDAAILKAKVIELNDAILSAQSSALDAQEELRAYFGIGVYTHVFVRTITRNRDLILCDVFDGCFPSIAQWIDWSCAAMNFSATNTGIRFRCALALCMCALPAIANGKTPVCQLNNQLEAAHYVLALKKKAETILRDNPAPLVPLKKYVLANVEFDPLAKFVLGPFWNDATPEQQVEYKHLFERTILHTLATHVLEYRSAKIQIDRQYALGSDDILVTSNVLLPTGRTLRIGWRIGFKDCRPTAVDLLKDGVSLITTTRQEFTAVVSRHGIAGLISMLRARAEKQNQQASEAGARNQDIHEILKRLFLEAAEKLKRQGGIEMF